jgi:hypothetical protein
LVGKKEEEARWERGGEEEEARKQHSIKNVSQRR